MCFNDIRQVELKLATERLHVEDLVSKTGQTDAFRAMMREKEALITERYKLNDTISQLRRQAKSAEDKWKAERSTLDKVTQEKTKALEDATAARDRLQNELTRIKVSGRSV